VSSGDYQNYIDTIDVTGSNLTVKVSLKLTDIIDNPLANLNAYPNPFNEYLIVVNTEKVSMVIITDATGKMILKYKCEGSANLNLPTGELIGGVYLITFETNDGLKVVKKMIKKE